MVALPPRALPFSLLYSTLAPEFLLKEILGHKQKILDSDRGGALLKSQDSHRGDP